MSVKTAGGSANGYHNATVCNVTLPTRRARTIRTSCDDANADGLDGTQPVLTSAALSVLASIRI